MNDYDVIVIRYVFNWRIEIKITFWSIKNLSLICFDKVSLYDFSSLTDAHMGPILLIDTCATSSGLMHVYVITST